MNLLYLSSFAYALPINRLAGLVELHGCLTSDDCCRGFFRHWLRVTYRTVPTYLPIKRLLMSRYAAKVRGTQSAVFTCEDRRDLDQITALDEVKSRGPFLFTCNESRPVMEIFSAAVIDNLPPPWLKAHCIESLLKRVFKQGLLNANNERQVCEDIDALEDATAHFWVTGAVNDPNFYRPKPSSVVPLQGVRPLQ